MDRKLRTLSTSFVFLRKERSDRGARRLSNKVEKIIDAAIKKIYLTAERPDVAAVVEEVNLQCFNSKIKGKPAPNTIRARVSVLSDRLKLEKREGRKRAAEKYESLKRHFPGADCPLAVAQIDHTPHGRHRGGEGAPPADPAAIFDRRHRRVQSHGARVRHLSREAKRLHSHSGVAG